MVANRLAGNGSAWIDVYQMQNSGTYNNQWMVWYGMVWYGMVWYGMVWYVNCSVSLTHAKLVILRYLANLMSSTIFTVVNTFPALDCTL